MTLTVYEQAQVQIVIVKDVRYARVITHSGEILQSFGRIDVPENHLRAELFVAAYNMLREVVQNYPTPNSAPFQDAAYAVFGTILGKTIVERLLNLDKF